MRLFNENDGKIFVNEVEKWIGTPHRNAHKEKNVGIDCARLAEAGLEGAGYLKPGVLKIEPNYTSDWYLYQSNENILLKYLNQVAVEIEDKMPQVGDMLLFQFGRQIGHLAIYAGKGEAIHAMNGFSVMKVGLGDDFFFDKHGRSRLRAIMRIDHDKLEEVNR